MALSFCLPSHAFPPHLASSIDVVATLADALATTSKAEVAGMMHSGTLGFIFYSQGLPDYQTKITLSAALLGQRCFTT